MDTLYNKISKKRKVEGSVFIPYAPSDQHTEQGLSVNNFQSEASKVQLDLTGDSEEAMKLNRSMKMWDRKKKKMVTVENSRKGKIKTESGIWIPATYKSNRYAQWKEKTKTIDDSDDNNAGENIAQGIASSTKRYTHWAKHNEKLKQKQKQSEMKNTAQILKVREAAERKRMRQKKKGSKGKGKKTRK